ncbi:MAG: serine/threonine protein kinase [Myxococcota bacterium]
MGSPVIAGRYTLLRKLGQGGMAEVFLARQEGIEGFQKLVVLKRILKHRAQDGEFVTMFLDEARLAADLRHPNVVSIFDINRDDGTYYMAMEFVHGHDLRRVMRTQAQRDDEFPVAHALHIALSAAAGLDYAHRKAALDGSPLAIVHRDVSPQNLIIGFAGEVKVADFGIAKATNVVAETAVGVVKGKYAYMAPEQARGETLDPSADQFALGVVLWEMLTLRRLFRRESDQQTIAALLDEAIPAVGLFRRGLPHGLEDILGKALQRNPARRFPSCGALAMALEELLAEQRLVHSAHRLGDYMQTLFDGAVETEGGLSRPALDEGASHGSGHAGPAESGVSPNETPHRQLYRRDLGCASTPPSRRCVTLPCSRAGGHRGCAHRECTRANEPRRSPGSSGTRCVAVSGDPFPPTSRRHRGSPAAGSAAGRRLSGWRHAELDACGADCPYRGDSHPRR